MKALYQNNLPTITDLLNQGVDVNLPYNDNSWTPFMWVCKEFYETDVIKQFLAYGGDVTLADLRVNVNTHLLITTDLVDDIMPPHQI